jgi:hypothetical protein
MSKNKLNSVRKHNGLSVRGFSKTSDPKLRFRDTPIVNGLPKRSEQRIVLNQLGPADTQ